MKITIKTLDSREEEFELADEITVRQLKDRIVEKMDIPLDKQRLLFHGKPLKDDSQLKECGISDGEVIRLVSTAPPTAGEQTTEQVPEAGEGQSSQQDMDTTQNGAAGETAAAAPPTTKAPLSDDDDDDDDDDEAGGPSLFARAMGVGGGFGGGGFGGGLFGGGPFGGGPFGGGPFGGGPFGGGGLFGSQDRGHRQARDVYRHVRTTRRCLKFAKKILDRHDRSEVRRLARKEAKDQGLPEPKDPPPLPEDTEEKDYIDTVDLDDESAEMPHVGANLFANILEEMKHLQDRANPLIEEYKKQVREERSVQGDESLHAQRITLTVKDFNYYIGHAYAASSRLQIAMQMGPPRYVKLVAPRRTEMRRVLQQLRDMPPQRPEPGYIIDIQRDEEGDAGDAAPAGDVAPTLSGGQEEGGLRYGGSRRFGPISIGASIDLGGLQPHQILPHTTVGEGGEIKEEDEEKKEEGEAKEEEGEAKEGEASTAKTEAEPVQEQPPEAEGATAKEPAEEKMEEEKKEEEEKKAGEGGEEGGRSVGIAGLLNDLITGVVDAVGGRLAGHEADEDDKEEDEKPEPKEAAPPQATADATGDGEKAEGDEAKEEEDEEKEERPMSFVERYAGPVGTTVTIQQTPQPPFGIPGLPPMPGPSISIRNPGGGQRPQVNINFPMPPALRLLQHLLERRERAGGNDGDEEGEEGAEKEEGEDGEKKEGEDGEKKEGEEGEKKEEGERRGRAARPPRQPRREEKPFDDEDDEVRSISDAGSLDSIDSDHELGPEVEHPMSRMATAAMEDMARGQKLSMHETMSQLRDEYGANTEPEPPIDPAELGIVELLLQMISRELSVVDVMAVFRGTIEPVQQLQGPLITFIQDRLLEGEEATVDKKDRAVASFLSGCIKAIESCGDKLPIREGVNFAQTIHNSLTTILGEGFDIILGTHEGEHGFANAMHTWGKQSSALFSNLIRHSVASKEGFETTIKELIVVMFPPSTPAIIMDMCSSSILREMRRHRKNVAFTTEELDVHLVLKEGFTIETIGAGGIPPPGEEEEEEEKKEGEAAKGQEERMDQGGASSKSRFGANIPQAMPKDWVPVIRRDRETLSRTRPQQPFSDAYLSGMPAKRRKIDTGEAETCTAGELFGSTLETAISNAGATPYSGSPVQAIIREAVAHEDLTNTFGQEVYQGMRERLEQDPDYQPERFPNAQRHYQPNK